MKLKVLAIWRKRFDWKPGLPDQYAIYFKRTRVYNQVLKMTYFVQPHLCRNEYKLRTKTKLWILSLAILASAKISAHPTGNMITVGHHVLWSYINPLDDPEHHACIMIGTKNAPPRVYLTSDYPASDYMLSNTGDTIYIIERRYIQASGKFEARVLKTRIGEMPIEIWTWFEDRWRIGEGGFFMLSDRQLVFAKFPGIYSLINNGSPAPYFNFGHPVKRIRKVGNNRILLLGESGCWLVDHRGKTLKEWNGLRRDDVENPPLDRNMLFDADYKKDCLLIAYWGNRSFELYSGQGGQKNILQLSPPLAPHWVAIKGDSLLLFSSELPPDGAMLQPNLLLLNSQGKQKVIWKIN